MSCKSLLTQLWSEKSLWQRCSNSETLNYPRWSVCGFDWVTGLWLIWLKVLWWIRCQVFLLKCLLSSGYSYPQSKQVIMVCRLIVGQVWHCFKMACSNWTSCGLIYVFLAHPWITSGKTPSGAPKGPPFFAYLARVFMSSRFFCKGWHWSSQGVI